MQGEPLPAGVVDWRHAAAGRQPAQRRRVEPPGNCQPPLEEPSSCLGVTGSEAATMAVYKEWVRRGEHRDSVWRDGTVRLGDRLVRIRNGRVSVVAAPSEKVNGHCGCTVMSVRCFDSSLILNLRNCGTCF